MFDTEHDILTSYVWRSIMLMRKMIYKILILTCGCLCLGPANAFADTIMIPIDFGGSASVQYNDDFLKAAAELDDVHILDYGERQALLDQHFIEVSKAQSDDLGMIDLAESGAVAYNDGEHDNADEMFSEAFKIAVAHPEFLAVSSDAAEEMWIAGAFWLQVRYYIKNDIEALKEAIDIMIRVFPLRTPMGSDFPDEIASIYRERMPNQVRGHKLQSIANLGCTLRINGDRLSNDESYYIYSGNYAIAKVCGFEVVRIVNMDIYEPTLLSLESGLFMDFDYPHEHKYVEHVDTTRDALSERLYQLAKILNIDQIVLVGYVPYGHPYLKSGYTALLANTTRKGLVRARTATPDDIATPQGMKEFASVVFHGGQLASGEIAESKLSPVSWSGIAVGSIGVATLIVGIVFGVLAKNENDEFQRLEKIYDDRKSGTYLDHAHKRDTYKTVADVSFGVGGGMAAIGLGLVLLDKLYLEPNSQNLYRAEGVKFQFDVHNDGVQAGLSWQF